MQNDPIRNHYELGYYDALEAGRKRMRSVLQNFKLAYVSGWYDAKMKRANKYEGA